MQKFLHPRIIILLCITICLFVTTNIHWGKDKWPNIIEADARGYYAYLPATFIYHDLNFTFYDSVERKAELDRFAYDYRVVIDLEKTVNKYFCGTAIAQSPFFLIAHGLSSVSGNETNGYSRIYMLFITIAGIFYLFIGLLFTDKLMELYKIKEISRSITIVAMLFGSNLFFYSVGEMGMSHVYSFAFIAMFCFFVKKNFLYPKAEYLFISMLLLGMIFLIRPPNLMIVLAVPFLAGDVYTIFTGSNTIKRNMNWFITGIILMLLIMSVQFIIYWISSGHFFVDSYPEENFHFTDPHFFSILFSYKKGLFLYTPVYLLALAGIATFYRKRKFAFFSFIFFFLILTYVLSSWWNWWYGGSFSSRVYVDYICLFAVLLASLLQAVKKKIFRFVLLPLLLVLIFLCQFQTYQYRYYLIHWENMTQEKYWDVFLTLRKNQAD
jgi:hypothetical protein